MTTYYKVTHPDGVAFHGRRLTYRATETYCVRDLRPDETPELCTDTVLHASPTPIQALGYSPRLNVALWEVEGEPVVTDRDKAGFRSLKVLRRIDDMDTAFGFRHSESLDPVHPADVTPDLTDVVALVREWAAVRVLVRDSVWASVPASLPSSIWDLVWASLQTLVGGTVWASIRAATGVLVAGSVGASFGAYISSLFPSITQWPGAKSLGPTPFESGAMLWRRGLVPVRLGDTWRLYHPERAAPARFIGTIHGTTYEEVSS